MSRGPTPSRPFTVDSLMSTPLFQKADPDTALYAAWLLVEGSGEAPWTRLDWALDVLDPFADGGLEKLTPTLYLEGVEWPIPGVGNLLVGLERIEWMSDHVTAVGDTGYYIADTEFVYGHDYNIRHQRYHWMDADALPVVVLRSLSGGDDLIAQSNLRWVRNNLDEYVGYDDNTVIVPADRPLHPAVAEALNAVADYPLLDEEGHSELQLEAEQEAWSSYGRSDFVRELTSHVQEYLEQYVNNDPDDEDYDPELPKVTDDDIEEAAQEHVDTIWSNIAQHANYSLWDEESGFDIKEAMTVLEKLLKKNDIVIAPILTMLKIPVSTGSTPVKCWYCGQALHQDVANAIWIDAAGGRACPGYSAHSPGADHMSLTGR